MSYNARKIILANWLVLPKIARLEKCKATYFKHYRRSHFVSHVDGDKHVSADDNDVMVYTRVSCNLMADPDIQNALYKSASAENLPKNKLLPVSIYRQKNGLKSSFCVKGNLKWKFQLVKKYKKRPRNVWSLSISVMISIIVLLLHFFVDMFYIKYSQNRQRCMNETVISKKGPMSNASLQKKNFTWTWDYHLR